MIPAPNGNARLRPGDRLWVDLTLSSEESDDGDHAAGDNSRRQLVGGTDSGTTTTLRSPGSRKSESGEHKRKHPSVGPVHGATSARADTG